jgi:hypothetical protein
MTPIDLTSELAPLIWTIQALMLVAVAWLVGMFFAEQMRSGDFRHVTRGATAPESNPPTPSDETTSEHDRRMAA